MRYADNAIRPSATIGVDGHSLEAAALEEIADVELHAGADFAGEQFEVVTGLEIEIRAGLVPDGFSGIEGAHDAVGVGCGTVETDRGLVFPTDGATDVQIFQDGMFRDAGEAVVGDEVHTPFASLRAGFALHGNGELERGDEVLVIPTLRSEITDTVGAVPEVGIVEGMRERKVFGDRVSAVMVGKAGVVVRVRGQRPGWPSRRVKDRRGTDTRLDATSAESVSPEDASPAS